MPPVRGFFIGVLGYVGPQALAARGATKSSSVLWLPRLRLGFPIDSLEWLGPRPAGRKRDRAPAGQAALSEALAQPTGRERKQIPPNQ